MSSRLIQPENTLKKKVGNGGFNESDLAKAQSAIENNTVDFKPIAIDLLKDLDKALAAVNENGTETEEALGPILDPLMKLRAQGSLFHYPTITHVSDIVVDFLDTVKAVDSDIIEILTAYKQSAKAILAHEIQDEANGISVRLVDELKGACQRYREKYG